MEGKLKVYFAIKQALLKAVVFNTRTQTQKWAMTWSQAWWSHAFMVKHFYFVAEAWTTRVGRPRQVKSHWICCFGQAFIPSVCLLDLLHIHLFCPAVALLWPWTHLTISFAFTFSILCHTLSHFPFGKDGKGQNHTLAQTLIDHHQLRIMLNLVYPLTLWVIGGYHVADCCLKQVSVLNKALSEKSNHYITSCYL